VAASHETEPVRSSRDRDTTAQRLTDWLQATVGDPDARIVDLRVPEGSGMSSETLLFDAAYDDGSGTATHALVARLAPDPVDVPVFASYDLELQFRVLDLVGSHSAVPVPTPRWLERDPDAIGTPFFVMERRSGRVPADIPPYVFGGWLLDADPADQRRLQDATVGLLADLHGIDLTGHDTAYLAVDAPGDTPLRRHVNDQLAFYDWVRGDRSHPVVDDAFAWLEANWPNTERTVVSWGDARIGNVMYASDGFEPVAVFDWEMAALGPPELDLGWMVFLHSFFQEIAVMLERPGLPDFMRRDDVVATYCARSGSTVEDLHWFEVYAATRHAVIMSRIRDRSVRFGEATWPDDIDEAIPHRALLRSMIEA
jgi:aminoglycoside phosphotransferase (APT) family kinase protein